MKRFTSILLCLIMLFSLCACDRQVGNSDASKFTQPETVTMADGSVVYSKEPFVEYPQTGEYKETALLTNVPGQGVPLLLDMREDGTIDYIFADVDEKADFQNFAGSGARYFTIAPDGTATEQDTEWMEGVDSYVQQTLDTTQDPNGQWRFLFTAEEGTILILAQYHNVVQSSTGNGNASTEGSVQYSTLLMVASGRVSVIPIEWEVYVGNQIVDLRSTYLSSVELKGGKITISKRGVIGGEYDNLYVATYNLDGTEQNVKKLTSDPGSFYYHFDDSGLNIRSIDRPLEIQMHEWMDAYHAAKTLSILADRGVAMGGLDWAFADAGDIQYTEDDSLYYLGKQLSSMKTVAYGDGKDFCCWFDEAGQGVLIRYTYNPEGKIEPEVVTVWSMDHIDLVETAVAQWNHTHASPIFRYETGEAELKSSNLTEEDILTRLNLELLNNRGPDVLILDGLDVERYLEYMTPLDRVNTDGVYESILTRFTVSDDLLAIPARVSPYLLGRTAEGTEDIESVKQFADIVEAQTTITGTYSYGLNVIDESTMPYYVESYIQLFRLWYPTWADAIWEGGKLNKEVFGEFLAQTTRLSKNFGLRNLDLMHEISYTVDETQNFEENEKAGNLDFYPYLRATDGDMRDGYEYSQQQYSNLYPYTLAAPDHVGLYTYWLYSGETKENTKTISHYLDAIPGPDGTGAMVPVVIAGVRAGGNEDAGQEFVQILLSRELQLGGAYHHSTQVDGYPVMWQYTEELIQRMEAYMHQDYAVENDYQEVLNNLRTVVIDETLYKMTLYAAQHCYRFAPNEVLTVDEATELLDELSRIYLAEKR